MFVIIQVQSVSGRNYRCIYNKIILEFLIILTSQEIIQLKRVVWSGKNSSIQAKFIIKSSKYSSIILYMNIKKLFILWWNLSLRFFIIFQLKKIRNSSKFYSYDIKIFQIICVRTKNSEFWWYLSSCFVKIFQLILHEKM